MPSARAADHPFKVPHRLTMGLSILHPGEPWIEIDHDLGDDLREKARLLKELRAQVYVEEPHSYEAQREVRDTLAAYLCGQHPDQYTQRGDRLWVAALEQECVLEAPRRPPLECASRWVQEDLCIMQKWEGAWRLSAASVCFPTRWDLPSKLGLPLTDIHGPVPGYEPALASSVDRFFERLKLGKIVWRVNWSLTDLPDLFQPLRPDSAGRVVSVDPRDAGDKVWIRLERQTLRRFPRSDAILFTIRVHRKRLRELRDEPDAAARLVGALRSMDPDLHRYKALPALHDAVIEYLQTSSAPSDCDRG